MKIKRIILTLAVSALVLSGCKSFWTTEKEPIIAQYYAIFDFKPTDKGWTDRLETAPFDKANRFYIAFAWIRDGKLVLNDADKGDAEKIHQLVEKIRKENPHAEILISSGFDDGTMYIEAAKDPEIFAQSVLEFIEEYNLDGYDMDWENGIDPDAMLKLVEALEKTLKPKDYLLTLALWQSTSSRFDGYKNQIGEISKYVDQINIMSYGNGRTVKESAEAYNKYGVPFSKLIGGIETEIDYPEVDGVDTLGEDGTIKQKCDYARSNGLVGMMGWRMDNDYRPINEEGHGYGMPTYKGSIEMYKYMAD